LTSHHRRSPTPMLYSSHALFQCSVGVHRLGPPSGLKRIVGRFLILFEKKGKIPKTYF
jgi:hypothetical protein